jgi:hypothetical protein
MKQLRFGRLGLLGLGFGLFASGCDYSNSGLGAAEPPAIDRRDGASGGRGGSSGGAATGGSAGTAGTGGTTAPPTPEVDASPPPQPPPPADAAPDSAPAVDSGSSGISSIDAAPAVDTQPSTPPPSMPACPTDPALLLCLDFEGAVRDMSEPPAPVTVRAVSFEAGPSGQAGRVSGDSQITLASGVGLGGGPFTVEAWLRPDSLPTGAGRAGVIDKQGHFGLFVLPGGNVTCYSQGAMATAAGVARAGQWLSATCTVGGGSVGIWINGVRRATAAQASGSPPGEPAIAVGSNSPTGDPFIGLLDNVRVWAGAREGTEVCQLAYDCD